MTWYDMTWGGWVDGCNMTRSSRIRNISSYYIISLSTRAWDFFPEPHHITSHHMTLLRLRAWEFETSFLNLISSHRPSLCELIHVAFIWLYYSLLTFPCLISGSKLSSFFAYPYHSLYFILFFLWSIFVFWKVRALLCLNICSPAHSSHNHSFQFTTLHNNTTCIPVRTNNQLVRVHNIEHWVSSWHIGLREVYRGAPDVQITHRLGLGRPISCLRSSPCCLHSILFYFTAKSCGFILSVQSLCFSFKVILTLSQHI